ncbi:MAG TPA: ABC transporter ATP-binding protein [Microbacteriaceae bacterium]|nr:ABC transporter ATP-binding protein [Microbacteriaceae bacterium]
MSEGPRGSFRQLLPYLAEHRTMLTVAVVLSVIGALAQLAQPTIVAVVIGKVQSQEPFGALVALLVSLVITAAAISAVQHYLLQRAGTAVVRSARVRLAHHLLRLPIREYDTRRTGDLVSRVGSDTTLLYAVMTQGLIDSLGGAFVLLGALIAMCVLDPVLLGATVLVVLVAVILVVALGGRMRQASREQQERVGDLAAAVERALSAIRTIRANTAEQRETEAIRAQADRAYDAGVKVARYSAFVVPVAMVALQVSLLVVLGLGGFRVASGAISVASLVAFIMFLFLMVGPLGTAFGAISSVNQALGALGRITEVLDVPAETAGDALIAEGLAAGLAPTNAPAIAFEGVSFGYEGGSDVLHGVSFAVPAGKRLALVGPSGAGKSTSLALIERFYDPTAGAVRLFGDDIRGLERKDLRSRIGYVEQEAPVLAGSLRENLLLAAPEASDDDCERVLRTVNLGEVLDRDERGLDAPVGEDGVMLSGGERQRLAIARALLQAPEVLLLDESTSSLDGVNEQRMRAAIDAASSNRTLIVIAHRLSTVVDADVIVVLEQGRVLGSGTHEELLESVPLYRELAATQLLT